jgi:hypothetical protein
VIFHVSLQIRFAASIKFITFPERVDGTSFNLLYKRLVASQALDFSLRLMIADCVELQRSLSLEELMTSHAFEGFFSAVRVLSEFSVIRIVNLDIHIQ